MSLLATSAHAFSVSYQSVVDSHSTIPKGQGDFIRFGAPYLHRSNVVFRGYGKNGQQGVYAIMYGNFFVIADTHTAIPDGESNFTSFGESNAPKMNPQQRYSYNTPSIGNVIVAFLGEGSNSQRGVYLYRNRKLQFVADTTTLVPNGEGDFDHFGTPFVNKRTIDFLGFGDNGQQGLYQFQNGELQMLYNTQTNIPAGKGTFTKFINPIFTEDMVAFQGFGPYSQQGIYAKIGDDLVKVANQETSVPGKEKSFVDFYRPSLQGKAVAFRAENKHSEGIYLYQKDKLTTIVDMNSDIPNGAGHFTKVYSPTYSFGSVVFLGKGEHNQQGVYVWHAGKLYKVIDNKDQLHGMKVKSLQLGAVSMSYRNVLFAVSFDNGVKALYMAKLKF